MTRATIWQRHQAAQIGPHGPPNLVGVSVDRVTTSGANWDDRRVTKDDLSPRPTAAAWVPIDGEARLIVRWIAEHAPDDTYARRALFVPQKRDLDMADGAIQAFGANGNVGSVRNPHISRGGPVLAYRPDVRLLAHAVAAAEGQVLGVIEFSPGEIAGWAAATNAVDLTTGEPTPSVEPEIRDALAELHYAGYNGYHRDREPFFAAKYFPPIDVLLAAGYSYKFVASYLVGLGSFGERVGDDLKRIYVPPERRRRVRKG
jgi:hypothetical protein